ncbi:MAG: AAA family ATPase [Mariprofundaceae bacterium]|nr:AAA family ATPase [Mariprofundaceae bacterium]
MYLEHWKLNDFPFDNVPSSRFYYETEGNRTLCEDLYDAIIRRRGAIVLTGDIGCGKTTSTQRVLLDLPQDQFDIALITYSRLTPVEMLSEIAQQLGLNTSNPEKTALLQVLRQHLAKNAEEGRDTLICIDEAQSIPDINTLEELRMLLNFQLGDRFLLTLLLVGQPELQRNIAKIPQLQQRIALNLHIGQLSLKDCLYYVLHRLRVAGCKKPILTRQAITVIHQHTLGVPRRINHLMDRCLLVGKRTSSALIDSKLVQVTMQRYPN